MRTIIFIMVAMCLLLGSVLANESDNMKVSSSVELRQNMRELWAEHVIWTRDFIIAVTSNSPNTKELSDRLMKNQEDIGNAVGSYYGKEAGDRLAELLKEHIQIAANLVTAVKVGDKQQADNEDKRWHDNAAAIATFLSSANSNWTKESLVDMLNDHLSLTAKEAKLRLDKQWSDDIENFDKIFDQSLHMADMLSEGIMKQFPAKFPANEVMGSLK